jgi:TRAP-type mannitol/chloroaromatic compound transport system substrate-binding protein
MKRRTFLTGVAGAGAAGIAATSTLPKPAIAQNRRQWTMVTSWPKDQPGPGVGADLLARTITELSGGELTVQVHGAGELVPALGVFDAVADGVADCYHAVASYWHSKSPIVPVFANVPFGLMATEQIGWMLHGNGQALYDGLYERFGLKGILCGNTSTQWGGWFNKEINSVDDLQGLRFRTPGLGGEMYRRTGASVVLLPVSEIFQALQSGTLDGAEYVGPWMDLTFGFHQAANYYYWPGLQEPANAQEFVMRRDAYEELPDHLKTVLRVACQATYAWDMTQYAANNPAALRTLMEEHNVDVRRFPDDVTEALGNAAGEVIGELRDHEDEMVKTIIEDWLAFRRDAMLQAEYGEHAMMSARMLAKFPE